jgi:hypothetical protein
MTDQPLDQRGRVLAVAVHEENPAQARVVETGKQRRLLAEIARQRDDLDIEAIGGERTRRRQRRIAAAVIDIDDFGCKVARTPKRAGLLDNARVQHRQAVRLVVQRHDN